MSSIHVLSRIVAICCLYASGFIGATLHLATWITALSLDIFTGTMIHQESHRAAYDLWQVGFTVFCISLGALLLTTTYHAVSDPSQRIPEGACPPFLMTIFMGGVVTSLLFSILQLVHTDVTSAYWAANATGTTTEQADQASTFRLVLAWGAVFKTMAALFLCNNQFWSGPAEKLRLFL